MKSNQSKNAAGRHAVNRKQALLSVLILSFIGPLTCPAQSKPLQQKQAHETKKESIYAIKYKTAQLGQMTVYAGQTGFKITGVAHDGNIVARAPDWKVMAFNTREKLCYETTLDKFSRQGCPGMIATTDYFEGRKLDPVRVTFGGTKALKLSAPTNGAAVGMMMPTYSGVARNRAQAVAVSVWCTAEPPAVPAQVKNLIWAVFKLPKVGGFPLAVSFDYNDGTTGHTMKALSITKVELDPDQLFAYPTGFKKERTAEAAILSGNLLDSAFMETPDLYQDKPDKKN